MWVGASVGLDPTALAVAVLDSGLAVDAIVTGDDETVAALTELAKALLGAQ